MMSLGINRNIFEEAKKKKMKFRKKKVLNKNKFFFGFLLNFSFENRDALLTTMKSNTVRVKVLRTLFQKKGN